MPRDLGLVGTTPLEPGEEPGSEERVQLRLLRPVSFAGHEALLLRVKPYADGGVHGGHLATVWNQQDAGYVLSLHFADDSALPAKRQEAAVRAAATAMSDSR